MLNYLGVLNRGTLPAHACRVVHNPAHSCAVLSHALVCVRVFVCVLTDPGVLNVNEIKMLFLKLIFEILMARQI